MKNRSLGFKLVFGGILLVAVPLVVAGVISAVKSSNALEDAARFQVVSTAQHLAENVKLLLNEEIKIATDLSIDSQTVHMATYVAKNGTVVSGAEIADMDNRLTHFMTKVGNDYEAIFLADSNGAIYSDGNGGGYKGIQIGEREYFKTAKSGKVNIGDVIKSKKTNLPVVTVCAPILSKTGEFVGSIVVVLKVGFVADRIASFKLGRTGYAYMVDRTGLMIAHPKKELVLSLNVMQQEGLKEIGSKMTSLKTGSEIYTFQGVKKMSGYAPVEMTRWCVGVTQDLDELLAPSHSIRNYILLAGFIFLAVTIVIVLFFARGMSVPIRRNVDRLNAASEQVASASSQVASTSQNLAEGASEQAASLEEIASSMEEMSSMTRQNADNAQHAKVIMKEAQDIVMDVDKHMNDLARAMADIAKSSEDTAKILRTIDEIAFQTNLLALNAAVEAARAGEAGAGFAVVAEEVRNLALRASEAAKNTSTLIENTMGDVRNGTHITDVTKEAFKRNMDIASKIGSLIDDISAASDEQVRGIEQVTKSVQEMDKVTQQTAANAEESASASEEMSAQAVTMREVIRDLNNVIGGNDHDRINSEMEDSIKAEKRRTDHTRDEERATNVRDERLIPFNES